MISKIVEESGSGIRLPYYKPEDHNLLHDKYSEIKGIKVLKTHVITNDLKKILKSEKVIIFHCYRDVRDVIVSFINKGWINKNIDEMIAVSVNYINDYNEIMTSNHNIISRKYEDFAFNIKEELKFIAESLKIKVNIEIIKKITKELDKTNLAKMQKTIPLNNEATALNQTFDKNTLIHTNHIHDGTSNQFLSKLNLKEIIAIESIAWYWLLIHNYKLYWKMSNLFLSFSQHADDYLSWQILGKKSNGVIVEVGAFDGIHLSNSFSLEQKGWKSINIEPSPLVFNTLLKNRPKAKNINCAIVGNPDVKYVDFFAEEIGVLSGCDFDEEDVRRRYKKRGIVFKSPNKINVQAETLNSILSKENIKYIDIISIDVEGYELEVLKGLDLKKYRVGLFIIEANNENQKEEILSFFKNHPNYLYLGNNYQNLFIIDKSVISKKVLRNINYKKYVAAKQYHTINPEHTIDSVPLNFKKSEECLKFQRYFKII